MEKRAMSTICFDSTKEFNKTNGSTWKDVWVGQLSTEDLILRQRLILEELGETAQALHQQNIVEIADGLTDLLYVVYGSAAALGTLASDQWIRPEEVCKITPGLAFSWMTSITRSASFYFQALASSQIDEVSLIQACQMLASDICGLGAAFGFPMEELFKEVHRSNMSKHLGNAGAGKKYGSEKVGKGPNYQPPRIREVLDGAKF
jgi:predicted HAD superfamily Cof-like phosphohydrolase